MDRVVNLLPPEELNLLSENHTRRHPPRVYLQSPQRMRPYKAGID